MASPQQADAVVPVDHMLPSLVDEYCALGAAAAISCQSDPRFTYYLYVPWDYLKKSEQNRPGLIVLMHSSLRNASSLRDAFQDFADTHNQIILCPLFPIGFLDPMDADNYKKLKYCGIRYDQIVLDMVREASARYLRLDASRFCLYGFSGGAQFVHRFAYLHPNRLKAICCAGPGSQTRYDLSKDFPNGVRDLHTVFGGAPGDIKTAWETLKQVPTLFICGEEDNDIGYLKTRGRDAAEQEMMKGGRFAATQRLENNWSKNGARSAFKGVPGTDHHETPLLPVVQDFFSEVIRASRDTSSRL